MLAAERLVPLAVVWLLWSTLCPFAVVGFPTFCPVTSPDDDTVYITDEPSQVVIGVSKTYCGVECALKLAKCRCFNYNETSMNCSLFDYEPARYSIDIYMSTIAYENIANPLKGLWSILPSANCSFPFTYHGVQYCDCRQSSLFANDRVCAKTFFSCHLPGGKPAFCTVGNQVIPVIPFPQDCGDHWALGARASAVYTIYIGIVRQALDVYCDMNTTTCTGWMVFQRRFDGSINFYRNWTEYANGFGNITREFWIGNDNLNLLTSTNGKRYKLRIDLADFAGNFSYADYDNFVVLSSNDQYKLASIGKYAGTAGDSLKRQLGQRFSTFDSDNDIFNTSCAVQFKGAWWYNNCHDSNLNGYYLKGTHASFANGVNWRTWTGYHYSLKVTEMKITPIN